MNRKYWDPLRICRGVCYRILNLFERQLSDETYLRCKWWIGSGRKLNLDTPITFNEKLQWLKIHDRNPLYTIMVDKCEVKQYVANIIGEDHIIPTFAIFDRAEEIDFDILPNQFVLKCTHDSGGVVICSDKTKLNKKKVINKLRRSLKINYYWRSREWPYKNVRPRIIAEKYMTDGNGELRDYKFFCFGGVPKMMFIATDRFNKTSETKFDFYDMNFNHLPLRNGHPNSTSSIEKPKGFNEMQNMAAKLSKGIPHVRVDFYSIKGQIYFGEMTFYHNSGLVKFDPKEWDYKIGEMLVLPNYDKSCEEDAGVGE